jgi:sugar/nucleoside kinase (ribokinase family)
VRLLIGLLHDPSPESRFFASIGLSRLEDEISRAILAMQRTVAEQPTAAAHEQLGQLYLDYAVSGFLEGVTRDYYLNLARQAFEAALAGSTAPDRLQQRLARVHLLLGNIAEAAALLDELAGRQPTEAAIHLLRMEVIYQFGDMRELALYARRARPPLSGIAEGDELLEWWATAGPQGVRVG